MNSAPISTRLFAAVGVVVQLKYALNAIWKVQAPASGGIWIFLRTYMFSLAGVMAVSFLLLVSLLVTTILSAAGKYLAPYLPETAMQLAGSAVSLG